MNNSTFQFTQQDTTYGTATPFYTRDATAITKSIPAKQGLAFEFTVPTVTNYTFICCINFGQNHGNSIYITNIWPRGAYLYNSHTAAQSTTATGTLLYMRSAVRV